MFSTAISLLLSLLILLCFPLHGHSSQGDEGRQKNFRILPFVAPAYSPELGLIFSAGGLMTFKTDGDSEHLQRSCIPLSVGVSTNGAVKSSAKISTFWFEDRFRANADIWLKSMPDHYYGVGYRAGRYTPKGPETTAYDRFWWQINPRFLFRVNTNLYTGLNLDLNQTRAGDISAGMAADPAYLRYGPDNFNGGAGIILQYDSRDVTVNAFSGLYLCGTTTFYGGYLGGRNTYQIMELDYRQYMPVGRTGRRLTWQVRTRTGVGKVPWGELSQLGTPFDLRGYTWGQYRDRTMIYALLEYRHQFQRSRATPNAFGKHESRHGAVAWIGLGSIGEDPGDLEYWLPNAGMGYRFEVQPRMNLRIDVGFGLDAVGFYIDFNEAF
jgi:hypothetical protein